MRVVVLLTCLTVLVRCGPVPACQLDELIGVGFAGACDDARAKGAPDGGSAAPTGPTVAAPFGNDTPDDIASDTAIHQSIGSVHQAAPVLHDAGPGPFHVDLLPPVLPGVLFRVCAAPVHARALYPPSPPTLKHRPLLI